MLWNATHYKPQAHSINENSSRVRGCRMQVHTDTLSSSTLPACTIVYRSRGWYLNLFIMAPVLGLSQLAPLNVFLCSWTKSWHILGYKTKGCLCCFFLWWTHSCCLFWTKWSYWSGVIWCAISCFTSMYTNIHLFAQFFLYLAIFILTLTSK